MYLQLQDVWESLVLMETTQLQPLTQPPGGQCPQIAPAAESPHYSRPQWQFWAHQSYVETRRQKVAYSRKGKERSLKEGQLHLAHLSTKVPSPKWNNWLLLPLIIVPLIWSYSTWSGLAISIILHLLAKTHLLGHIFFLGWETKKPRVLKAVELMGFVGLLWGEKKRLGINLKQDE